MVRLTVNDFNCLTGVSETIDGSKISPNEAMIKIKSSGVMPAPWMSASKARTMEARMSEEIVNPAIVADSARTMLPDTSDVMLTPAIAAVKMIKFSRVAVIFRVMLSPMTSALIARVRAEIISDVELWPIRLADTDLDITADIPGVVLIPVTDAIRLISPAIVMEMFGVELSPEIIAAKDLEIVATKSGVVLSAAILVSRLCAFITERAVVLLAPESAASTDLTIDAFILGVELPARIDEIKDMATDAVMFGVKLWLIIPAEIDRDVVAETLLVLLAPMIVARMFWVPPPPSLLSQLRSEP